MKVDYDSEGRSLLFEFEEFREAEDGDDTEDLAGGVCLVGHLDGRFGLDAEALRSAVRAALAAPDREIHIEVGKRPPQ